jgi:hypothetical protein
MSAVFRNLLAVERAVALVPAVSIKKSITPDYIICPEDGKHFKSMKRHLATKFGMTPDEYRGKWNLPSDYPVVAAAYATKRSELALSLGLGRKNVERVAEPVAAKPERGQKAANTQSKELNRIQVNGWVTEVRSPAAFRYLLLTFIVARALWCA